MIRVLQGEPWLFEGHAIVLGPWEAEKQLDQITLDQLPCWVQIWNLPPSYIDTEIGIAIGGSHWGSN
ncbi:hypothetical protein LIER_43340 [Lithospermum erythrorhizon]|uniref:DUF4283 domain-containing protein n=1 Tax=Lithospermum erythrorhizon TaxID=34254 RepID=A0AAV3Q068_LITER